MNQSKTSAQPCGSLYFVGITTTYPWASGCNMHCGVFLRILEKVNIVLPVGRCSWNWRIWFGSVQLRYSTGNDGTPPSKMLLSSVSLYWTHMLWDSGMIPWLALVYSILQSSPRHSTAKGQWNGLRYYNSPFWSLINILTRSTFSSYPSTSPQISCPQSSSIGAWNSCPNLGIPKSSDWSLREVNLILWHTLWMWVSLKWCACCNTGWKNVSSWQGWTCKRWDLQGFHCLSVAESRLKPFTDSILYQPWKAKWDSVSSISSRPVNQSLCLTICWM